MLVDLNDAPDIVGIIPTLGKDATRLSRCLDALRDQRGEERLAVIVVVNGPADLADEPDVTMVRAGLNLGWSGGLAFGRAIGSAPLLWLVQDDMTPSPDALQRLADALRADDEVAAVVPVVIGDDGLIVPRSCGGIMNDEGEIARWLPAAPIRPEQLTSIPQLGELAYVPSRGMLVKLADWDATGGMDPGYYPVLWSDVDFCLTLTESGRRFALVPSALIEHPGNGSSTPAYAQFLHERNGRRFRRLRREQVVDAPLDPRIPADTLERVARSATEALAELGAKYSALTLAPHALIGVAAPPLPGEGDPRGPGAQADSRDSGDPGGDSRRDIDFPGVYERVVRFTQSELSRTDPTSQGRPVSEPIETAMFSVLGVPESALLEIADDRQFVVAAYAKLLDRLPSRTDVDEISRRLEIRATTRRAVLNQLLGSEEYRMMGARIEVRRE